MGVGSPFHVGSCVAVAVRALYGCGRGRGLGNGMRSEPRRRFSEPRMRSVCGSGRSVARELERQRRATGPILVGRSVILVSEVVTS